MRSSLDVEYLVEALGSLPNLTSIRLTSGGIGGPQKLSMNKNEFVYIPGPITRGDGRQLRTIFQAAAAASSSPLNNRAKIETLVVDKYFWDGEHTQDEWLRGLYPPDFGSLDANVITAALPFLENIMTLKLPLHYRKDDREGISIERNLTALLAGLPVLKDLTLHNPEIALLRMHSSITAMESTTLRTLKLQSCVLHMKDMEKLLEYSKTLKVLHLHNVALEAGDFVGFFTSVRNSLSLVEFVLKGWLIEVEDNTILYAPGEETDDDTFWEVKARRQAARDFIESFVKRETDHFPVELLGADSSGSNNFSFPLYGGLGVVLGASKLRDSDGVDFR